MDNTDFSPIPENDYVPGLDEDEPCWYCGGDGWGIIGLDWDCDDSINGPYDGETELCPCCRGSGMAIHCTFW